MNKIEEALWNDYVKAGELISSLTVGSDGYNTALEAKDKIRKELIELKKIEEEKCIKISQIKSEDRREKIRNGITIGTFVISTGVSIYAIARTFKFDQVATVTSTLGRGILNSVIPKIKK